VTHAATSAHTTPVPVALQLYCLREALTQDLRGTIERVARLGYQGVEPFGLTRQSAPVQKALFDEYGLQVPSVHAPLHLPDKADEALAGAQLPGCQRIASGSGPGAYAARQAIPRRPDAFNHPQPPPARPGLRKRH